jgi:hypothetical protein
MDAERSLWRAARWPVLLLAIAGVGIVVAAVLDRTAAREWALTIGAPALLVLLPIGVVWLLAVVVLWAVRGREPG